MLIPYWGDWKRDGENLQHKCISVANAYSILRRLKEKRRLGPLLETEDGCKCLFHIEEIESYLLILTTALLVVCCKCLFHIEEIERTIGVHQSLHLILGLQMLIPYWGDWKNFLRLTPSKASFRCKCLFHIEEIERDLRYSWNSTMRPGLQMLIPYWGDWKNT